VNATVGITHVYGRWKQLEIEGAHTKYTHTVAHKYTHRYICKHAQTTHIPQLTVTRPCIHAPGAHNHEYKRASAHIALEHLHFRFLRVHTRGCWGGWFDPVACYLDPSYSLQGYGMCVCVCVCVFSCDCVWLCV